MRPLFIKSVSGNLFSLYYSPKFTTNLKRNILFIPPFAEELNRSRHMINRQARRLANAGYGVFILDLFGTGDSEGTYAEATIDIWQKDILSAVSWLKNIDDIPISLWAMRSGALITADLIQKHPEITDQLLLWSPVSNGKKFISQHMRIKLAAEITGKTNSTQTTMKDLWAELDQGNIIEIAGYDLSPELAYGFSALSLADCNLPKGLKVKWLEISLNDPALVPPAAQKIINMWKKNEIDVTPHAINDVAFWTLQEPEWANKYIEQTLRMIT